MAGPYQYWNGDGADACGGCDAAVYQLWWLIHCNHDDLCRHSAEYQYAAISVRKIKNCSAIFYLCATLSHFIFCIDSLIKYLKNRSLVQDQGGLQSQRRGLILYFEELKRGPNTEIGPKNIFEMVY